MDSKVEKIKEILEANFDCRVLHWTGEEFAPTDISTRVAQQIASLPVEVLQSDSLVQPSPFKDYPTVTSNSSNPPSSESQYATPSLLLSDEEITGIMAENVNTPFPPLYFDENMVGIHAVAKAQLAHFDPIIRADERAKTLKEIDCLFLDGYYPIPVEGQTCNDCVLDLKKSIDQLK
jgi:hypothetical protein